MGETTALPMALNPNICPGSPLSVLTVHGSNCKNNLWNSLNTNLEEH